MVADLHQSLRKASTCGVMGFTRQSPNIPSTATDGATLPSTDPAECIIAAGCAHGVLGHVCTGKLCTLGSVAGLPGLMIC